MKMVMIAPLMAIVPAVSFAKTLANTLTKTKMIKIFLACLLASLASCSIEAPRAQTQINEDSLAKAFMQPPQSAKPGVYWYFMDGNQDQAQMTKDLEAMAKVGISKVIYLEVLIGVPRGPVAFMSEQWQDNFAHAVKTAERLNMEVILGTGPGWSGSGGPWVKPEESMQHLVSNSTKVIGPVLFNKQVEIPKPPKPNHFAGMSEWWLKVREQWHEDVAVLAFPTPALLANGQQAKIELADIKTLKETQPYSIWKHVPRYISAPAHYDEPEKSTVIEQSKIIDLTDKMAADGTLTWHVPEGNWTIMRFVARTTGQTSRPAPMPGRGFESDKFSSQAFLNHWDNFQGKLLKKVNPGKNTHDQPRKGWTRIHLDSWEMSSQNWTQTFKEEFVKRRGYDPTPFYPAYAGLVVASLEKTERFLWDLRKTSQELVLENYAGTIKAKANEHGMLYSNQPYDMNPAGNIDLGSIADIPSCEFWDYRNADKVDSLYGCIEATSIAHTMGKAEVPAEAFTSILPQRFHAYPGQMKNQTDWAFAFGVNNLIFHTFLHQPLGDDYLPGMAMGPHGINWHRHQNWWDMLPAYHNYVSRASHLLQQGVTVSDILYLTPEGVPHIFLPPSDALIGEGVLKDKRGYSFDAVSPRILMNRATVVNDRIAFADASAYKILVLPDADTMTPPALEKILSLVEAGATIVGNPPIKSPSLVNYPDTDVQVKALASKLWGSLQPPEKIIKRRFGQGFIYWGLGLYQQQNPQATGEDGFYPSYETTASLLNELGLAKDFSSVGDSLRFTHRKTTDKDIYFVANRTDTALKTTASFRLSGVVPQLWHPQTGQSRALAQYSDNNGIISIPLSFAGHESYFIVFSKGESKLKNKQALTASAAKHNFPQSKSLMTLKGSWDVAFDNKRGGPEKVTFEQLIDWRQHSERGIKYYSGIATYSKSFDLPEGTELSVDLPAKYSIDLGIAYEMARVTLNGVEQGIAWTPPWQVTLSGLKAKGNVLTIDVANSWENRLIGDSQAEDADVRTVQWTSGLLNGKPYKAGRFSFSTYQIKDYGALENKEPALQASGLIGPVRIITNH